MMDLEDSGSEEILSFLQCGYAALWRAITDPLEGIMITILGDVSASTQSRHGNWWLSKQPRFFVFQKDHYLFFGPYSRGPIDPCPLCILMTLATDEESLDAALAVGQITQLSPARGVPEVINPICEVGYWNRETGATYKFPIPVKHPACDHGYFGFAYPILCARSNDEDLLRELSHERVGVFRYVRRLKSSNSEALGTLGESEVVLSWFANPAFPLFPAGSPLELAQGTGFSLRDAQMRAVFESLERYSALSPPQVPPDAVCSSRNIEPGLLAFPMDKIDADSIRNWYQVHDLDGKFKLVPEQYIYINPKSASLRTDLTTSGCAAHTQPEAAMLNGLLELLERDHILRHWLSGEGRPHIRVDTIPPRIRTEVRRLESLGFEVLLIDCSVIEEVFVVEAVLWSHSDERPSVIVTSGASHLLEEAISRAVRELMGTLVVAKMTQGWATRRDPEAVEITSGEDHFYFYQNPSRKEFFHHYLEASSYKDANENASKAEDWDTEVILQRIHRQLKTQGIDSWFADLTPTFCRERGVFIYRCICPSLIPLTFGSGKPSLPKAMWRPVQITPVVLNVPHPFS